jgi:branched-subunit amino acid ABC-type transport system permease component
VYGVAAMGLTLIWGVMSVINLSHGPVMALGMFGTYLCFMKAGFNPYLALPVVAVLGWLVCLFIYVTAVHRAITAPHLSATLHLAVNMIIIGTAPQSSAPLRTMWTFPWVASD